MFVPPLPVEIIEHIIKQSLPPLRVDTFEERYRILKTVSLVDSTWRVLAQKELGRHLVLEGGPGRTFETSPVARANSHDHAKSLWSYSDGMTPFVSVCGGLERCTGVEEVQLNCGVVEERFWASALRLRSLSGNFIYLNLSEPLPPFHHLSHLCLSEPLLVTPSCAWSRLLNPVTLPSLRCLKLLRFNESDFVRGYEADFKDSNDIFAPLLSLASQLEEFGIYERDEQVIANRLSSTDWRSFIELQLLTVGTNSTCFATWANNPKSTPPKLRSLVILDLGESGQAELYEEMQGLVARWGHGRGYQITIKRKTGVISDDDGTVQRARQAWIRSAEESGIVVNEVLANGSFGDWETFFNIW